MPLHLAGRGLALLAVPWVLREVAVLAQHAGGDGEEGGVAVALVGLLPPEVVGLVEAVEADEVLPAPSLPVQFHEPLVEDVGQRGLALGHAGAGPHGIQVVGAVAPQPHLGLGTHQQHVGKAEEHDVVGL